MLQIVSFELFQQPQNAISVYLDINDKIYTLLEWNDLEMSCDAWFSDRCNKELKWETETPNLGDRALRG